MLTAMLAGRFDMVSSSVSRTHKRVEPADFFVTQVYVANGVGVAVHTANTDITS
ncbi:hypothetical protein GCM10011415_26510 [Salipiger pallidus]|uniref:Uncharacterized protein n=1 Tax=Salipiger pallidus TaxID=1775170 RepID=A0A8J2ZKN3_9RHOB|nr:hypothetical protein GCM10011415_26510 [Salipiger pallidus]